MSAGTDLHYVGALSETLVTAHLMGQGFDVYTPSMGQGRCDLVYLTPSAVRVQVKTSTNFKSGAFIYEQCRLSQSRGTLYEKTYSAEEIDEVWIVGTHLWRFPISLVGGRTCLFLGSNNPSPKAVRRNYDPTKFVEVWGSAELPFRNRLSLQLPPDARSFAPLQK